MYIIEKLMKVEKPSALSMFDKNITMAASIIKALW